MKTFNLDKETYEEFSKHCKEKGISMSKKVGNFIKEEVKRIKEKNVGKNERGKKVKVRDHSFSKYC